MLNTIRLSYKHNLIMHYNVLMMSLPQPVQEFMDVFRKHDFQIYTVGGSVRDILLEKPILNWDFTTNSKPEEILKLFPDGFYHNTYGTVTVPINVETGPSSVNTSKGKHA